MRVLYCNLYKSVFLNKIVMMIRIGYEPMQSDMIFRTISYIFLEAGFFCLNLERKTDYFIGTV